MSVSLSSAGGVGFVCAAVRVDGGCEEVACA